MGENASHSYPIAKHYFFKPLMVKDVKFLHVVEKSYEGTHFICVPSRVTLPLATGAFATLKD